MLPIGQITWLPIANFLIQFMYRVFQYFWQFRLFWWMTNPALGRRHPKTRTHPFLIMGTRGGPESRFPEKLVSLWTAESRGENSIGFCQIWKTRRGPFRTRFSISHVPMSNTVEYIWFMSLFRRWLTHSAGKLWNHADVMWETPLTQWLADYEPRWCHVRSNPPPTRWLVKLWNRGDVMWEAVLTQWPSDL